MRRFKSPGEAVGQSAPSTSHWRSAERNWAMDIRILTEYAAEEFGGSASRP
jgi:hypothetical protein